VTLSPGTRLGPYEIEETLGRGGMGEVYRALDTRLGRAVAVKILPAIHATDAESVRRFEKEARAVASLSHPNIVPLFDVGEHDGLRYAVTELVTGETLRMRLAAGPLPSKEAAEIAAQVAHGLEAAHEKGVIHRDIKPENIVITSSGFARILDFGLAKRSGTALGTEAEDQPTASELLTEPGVVAGTVGYMSPEQVRGLAIDGRSDIFSLGVVLWEMLTGHRPFSGDSQVETLNAILKEEPQPALALDVLPTELARIVRRCLEKRKEDRYHSAADLAHDLKNAAGAVTSAITRLPAAAARPAKSRRMVYASGAVLLAAILAAILFVPRRRPPITSPGLPRTLAVLPFRAIAAEGMPEHFGLGLADSLIGRLATVRELTVRPTSAIARYETGSAGASEVGRQLGVDAVLEGTYQKLEGMTRVLVQMTDVSRGGLLWSDRIDLPEGRLFELQDAISRQVTDKLQLALAPSLQRTLGPSDKVPDRVMEQYLTARAGLARVPNLDPEQRQQVAASFDPIVEQAPNFARALGARAYARAWGTFVRPSTEGYAAALSDADRATELDPDLAEPRVARASLAWSSLGGWDIVKAVRDLKQAIEKSPGLEIAYFDLARIYHHNGWISDCEKELRAGERINPANVEVGRQRAVLTTWSGDLRGAAEIYDRLPEEYRRAWSVRWQRAWLRTVLDDPRGVEPDVERVIRETTEEQKPTYSALLAIVRARQGRDFSDLERDILASDHRRGHFHHVYHFLADSHAQRGDVPRAADYLRRAAETGFPCAPAFDNDPLLAPIRGSKEYAAVKREIEERTAGYRAALKDVL
jgi:TolB-like protein/tetratricopeptide (TPR) repeat protein